jgi:GDPmannose 4,6-dehydratase
MAARRALITGITGQDGSYLAEWLLGLGYEVHGLVRAPARRRIPNLQAIQSQLYLWPSDLCDTPRIARLLKLLQPDEIYNLAAITFVGDSWTDPNLCYEVNARAVVGLLEAVRTTCPLARFFQASTSELFGQPEVAPQTETTPLNPRSPYGLAKLAAHQAVRFYREKHGLFAAASIMFNHESPRRGPQFVTRKVTHTLARIKRGLATKLRLGNLQARRDWGFAGDFVRAMHGMLQLREPRDLVIGTGRLHSVEEFVAAAFTEAGLSWTDHVVVDPEFYRPAEPIDIVADASTARRELGWEPQVDFADLLAMMVRHDLELIGAHVARPAALAA